MATINSESIEKNTTKPFTKISHLSENLPAVRDAAMEQAENFLDEARSFVKKNPLATVAAGIGVGFLIGLCLKRD